MFNKSGDFDAHGTSTWMILLGKAENFKINTEQKIDLPEFVRMF